MTSGTVQIAALAFEGFNELDPFVVSNLLTRLRPSRRIGDTAKEVRG